MTRLASDRHKYNGQHQPFGTIARITVKVPNLVQMRLISYRLKMETFMFVAEFRYACFTHTYTFYLLRQGSVQLKNLKGDVDLPK